MALFTQRVWRCQQQNILAPHPHSCPGLAKTTSFRHNKPAVDRRVRLDIHGKTAAVISTTTTTTRGAEYRRAAGGNAFICLCRNKVVGVVGGVLKDTLNVGNALLNHACLEGHLDQRLLRTRVCTCACM